MAAAPPVHDLLGYANSQRAYLEHARPGRRRLPRGCAPSWGCSGRSSVEMAPADVINMFMAAEMRVFKPSRSLRCGVAAAEGGVSQLLVGLGTLGSLVRKVPHVPRSYSPMPDLKPLPSKNVLDFRMKADGPIGRRFVGSPDSP